MNAKFGARMGASMRTAALALAAFAVLTTTADAQVVRNDLRDLGVVGGCVSRRQADHPSNARPGPR